MAPLVDRRAVDRADLFRTLGVLAESPGPAHSRLAGLLDLPTPAATDWAEAFLVQLVPHASIYLGRDGMLGGEAADRIAGFWRALRLDVPSDPDHLTALLGLYASLCESQRSEPDPARRLLWRQARTTLLHEHLVSWLLPYAHAMVDAGPDPYARWARLLAEALRAETTALGPPERLPAVLREAPAMPSGGLDDLVAGLLTPARSGIVLTRAHLAEAARQRSLGLRLGDRRRMLRALLEQDPHAALAGLAAQARRWVARHRADEPVTGPIARHWAARASTTLELLTRTPPTRQEESP